MACLPCLLLPALAAGSAGIGGLEATTSQTFLTWLFTVISLAATIIWFIFIIRKADGKCKSCSINKNPNK